MQADLPNHSEWVVIQTAQDSVSAVDRGKAYLRDGLLVVNGVTTYPYGTRESAGTTPAYIEERIQIDCSTQKYKVLMSAFMRGNADSIHDQIDLEQPFVAAGADTLRAAQIAAVCQGSGSDDARTRSFRTQFSFIQAYERTSMNARR